jgi:hypothetical protein
MSLAPPFNESSALKKVRLAEDAWNSRDPERVSLAYSPDTHWRNRSKLIVGRDAVRAFLADKWDNELEYRLAKELWAFGERKIAVRFQYEYRTPLDAWVRAYGNELWEFDDEGLMCRREASINDRAIDVSERRFHWPAGLPRPADQPGLINTPE